ncbi:MAG: hypothetical protein KDK66_00080 [Deltaproteobacteria bacterium]|nr:hypothetical protein [Deltaproteobacteria bacterium]
MIQKYKTLHRSLTLIFLLALSIPFSLRAESIDAGKTTEQISLSGDSEGIDSGGTTGSETLVLGGDGVEVIASDMEVGNLSILNEVTGTNSNFVSLVAEQATITGSADLSKLKRGELVEPYKNVTSYSDANITELGHVIMRASVSPGATATFRLPSNVEDGTIVTLTCWAPDIIVQYYTNYPNCSVAPATSFGYNLDTLVNKYGSQVSSTMVYFGRTTEFKRMLGKWFQIR